MMDKRNVRYKKVFFSTYCRKTRAKSLFSLMDLMKLRSKAFVTTKVDLRIFFHSISLVKKTAKQHFSIENSHF